MFRLNSLLDQWPDHAALIYEGLAISADSIRREAAKVAAGLGEAGVVKGDRVAVWLPNCPAWLEVLFGCAQIGAIAVAINTRFKSVEVQDIVGRSGAKALVMWPGFKGINFLSILQDVDVNALSDLRTVIVLGDAPVAQAGEQHLISYDALKDHPPLPCYDAENEDGCAIFTTSGTTKAPKFVLHNHRSTVHHANDVVNAFSYNDVDACFMLAVPLCGVFGYAQMMATLAARRPTVLMPSFDGPKAADLIRKNRVTHLNATDDMLEGLLAQEDDETPFPTLRRCGFASFNRDPNETMRLGEARGLPLVGLYGMSEVQALFAGQAPSDPPDQRSLGGGVLVSPEARVRVRDPDSGQLLGLGEPGELELRGPSLMAGYFENPEATADAITEDGFIRTGDLGYQTEDGFVFLTRMGDAMRLGGFLVNPAEISGHIESLPEIVEAQVVAITQDGKNRPFAFVRLEEGARFDELDILAHCQGNLAAFKVPVGAHAIKQFPVAESANGTKIQRNKLRQMAEALMV
jgi:fatty-acyl-CoA synthase